jgi:2-amino-4-hydroxy-6-hydroxymethyldihydropteridine diphosphokinase
MARLLISLGANLGNSYETMTLAAVMLREAFGSRHVQLSRLFATPPIGGPAGQSDFLNAVAMIQTEFDCWRVWEILKRIEKDLGRQRQHRWEARRLDMDILLLDEARVWTPHLKIPHPRMCMRSFVLVPAMDVAPDIVEPVTGWTIEKLHLNLQNASQATILIYSNTEDSSRKLSETMASRGHSAELPSVRFLTCKTPEQISNPVADLPDCVALRIFCVRTPEPETIQWEDYARPWADALGMVHGKASPHSKTNLSVEGPRYLMPDNETSWTVHEIDASRQATRCPIEPIDRQF